MKNVIRSISLLAGVALSAGLAAPADAYSVTLQPLVPQVQTSSHVAVAGACRTANVDAAVDGTAFFEKPAIAEQQGIGGTSDVMIRLAPTGALVSESILQSSGNSYLDRAAMLSARLTKFAPEIHNCAAIGGTYLYNVEF